MDKKHIDLVKSILGDDIFEELEKSAIHKLNTNTAVEPEEIKVALQIVPRSVLSYLFQELKYKPTGDVCELDLPFAPAKVLINKRGPDNYSGEIIKEGERVLRFENRSLPSIGLLLLTTFELYDLSLLDEIKKNPAPKNEVDKLQDIIDQRLSMTRMVQEVVDRKLSAREAIDRLIKEKLSHHMMFAIKEEEHNPVEEKKSKLRQFLENKESRRQEHIDLDKKEVNCPDCSSTLYKGDKFIKLCLCYGEYLNKEIKILKKEDGRIQLKFPKKFNIDNVEMLLDALKKK